MKKDAPDVLVHPPIALVLVLILAFVLDRLLPLPFVPPSVPHSALGSALILVGLALAAWSVATFRKAKTEVLTSRPALTIVSSGPYRFSRNPIYLGMFLALIGLAVGFDTLWFLFALITFYIIVRFAVVAPEEQYLTEKFGAPYLDYKARVRRWL